MPPKYSETFQQKLNSIVGVTRPHLSSIALYTQDTVPMNSDELTPAWHPLSNRFLSLIVPAYANQARGMHHGNRNNIKSKSRCDWTAQVIKMVRHLHTQKSCHISLHQTAFACPCRLWGTTVKLTSDRQCSRCCPLCHFEDKYRTVESRLTLQCFGWAERNRACWISKPLNLNDQDVDGRIHVPVPMSLICPLNAVIGARTTILLLQA